MMYLEKFYKNEEIVYGPKTTPSSQKWAKTIIFQKHAQGVPKV